ncbi:uncharacterized protein BJX67DRAFT_379026 [Aspergillus lucknowensis]|uniref:Nucleoside phosphorylase domain-containing protein n=1 Tax=Aspergillus lucknowensis TaxID=176173 RepID=A0ABR4M1P2_9EURO
MLLTDSPGWNGVQALRSHLSGRLARFTRTIAPSAPVNARKWRNDAAFLDTDLRSIITATPATIEHPENDYSEIEQTALNLLSSLNEIVNNDLVKPSQAPECHSQNGMALLGDQYPSLDSLIKFVDCTPGQYNLIIGPRALFKLPENQTGKSAIDRVIAWKELLERTILGAKELKNVNLPIVQQHDTPESPLAQEKPGQQQRTASAVIDAIFKDFQQRDCGISHEIKLRISDEWQSDTHQAAFDMFISVCHQMVWQEAKCGSFKVKVDPSEKNSICNAIHRAQANGKVLHVVVDQQGLFDITDKMPAVMSSVNKLSVESLAQLLDQKVFTRITARDYLAGTAKGKFSSREKALLALSLARCLMDFFNQDLELGLYTWKPESLYFLRPSGTQPSHRALYISLKPKESAAESSGSFYGVGPGNPVLLSFAKLLLEIDSGDTIPIEIQPESKANLSKWAEMCDFVNVAEREGSANYLKAVEGCLYLHMALPKFLDQEGSPVTDQILRKAIYEQVVRNLELMANPETSKRKRRDSVSDLPLSKKLSLAPPVDHQPSVGLPAQKPTRPSTRNEFEVAIVCALSLEYNAVSTLVDEFWDEDGEYYGRADGDTNIYTTGRIGKSNVVLVLLAGMGKVSAAAAAASLRSSYPGLRLALVTGICGGVPYLADSEELLLGDVVISKRIVQYDFGKQYPDGFSTTTAVEDSLGRASKHIRNLLAVFETDTARDRLERKAAIYLQQIQDSTRSNRRTARYKYPGASQDRLFQAHYQHKHHRSAQCSCTGTRDGSSRVCNESRTLSCDELGCDSKYLVRRERLEIKRQLEAAGRSKEAQAPSIYIGSIGSGDAVIKSGEDRDRIAKIHGIAAFEMEGAGVWEEIPCIVIKAVCDYADSHKNKSWQHFAAAAAASTAKALLERYIQTGKQWHGRFER